MNELIASALLNWIPYRLHDQDDGLYSRWLYLGDKQFEEPFFEDSILKCLKLPDNSRQISTISHTGILPEWAACMKTISPDVIIFHISRCGSTLVSQLLSLQPANIVLSEVPFFDELLRHGFVKKQLPDTLPLLKAAIAFYGAKRSETSRHLVIKADSWHIHFYKQYRELFPQTPFILLYRQPDEVIRSHQKKRGMQSVPGVLEPEIFGFDKNEISQSGLNEYMAKVIETYLAAFIEILQTDKLTLPVNYNEGISVIVKKIARVTGISISEKELTAMQERSTFHAKYPDQVFNEEQEAESIPAYLSRSFTLYREIEKIRTAYPTEK